MNQPVAIDLFQSNMITLSDNGVSRLLAAKAMQDQAFRDTLLSYASLKITPGHVERSKKFKVIIDTIKDSRKQLAEKAGLEAPTNVWGAKRDLNTYLMQVSLSRELVAKANIRKEGGTAVPHEEAVHEWGWVGNSQCVTRLALSFLQSTLRFQADPWPFPFECLPPELRLQIYREALRGLVRNGVACGEKIVVFCNRREDFQCRFAGQQKGESKDINVSLLATNKLVNHEAIPVLYQLHTFDFTRNVGNVMPFLRSLSDETQQNLRGVSMELHNRSEPDHCCGGMDDTWGMGSDNQAAWGKACSHIAKNVNVKELSLTINVKVPADFKTLKWVKALVKIKGLKRFTLQASQHRDKKVSIKASHQEGSLVASGPCFSEHLVQLFEYLREEMLE